MLYDPNWKPKTDEKTDEVVIKRDDLTKDELWGLLRVREALKSGVITAKQFEMDRTFGQTHCGTVGCIGGWMGTFLALRDGIDMESVHDYFDANNQPPRATLKKLKACFAPIDSAALGGKFHHLFYPEPVYEETQYYFGMKATPEDGIKAIDNFLAGERFPWKDWKPSQE